MKSLDNLKNLLQRQLIRYLSLFYFVGPLKLFVAGTPMSVRNSAYSDMAALVYTSCWLARI